LIFFFSSVGTAAVIVTHVSNSRIASKTRDSSSNSDTSNSRNASNTRDSSNKRTSRTAEIAAKVGSDTRKCIVKSNTDVRIFPGKIEQSDKIFSTQLCDKNSQKICLNADEAIQLGSNSPLQYIIQSVDKK
jgi:hypothetical protein